MEGNNSSKYEHYQKLINIAKMCDEINSSKYEKEKMICEYSHNQDEEIVIL